jgi:hypothetical protein
MAQQELYGKRLRDMEKDNEALRAKFTKEQTEATGARGKVAELERREKNLVR